MKSCKNYLLVAGLFFVLLNLSGCASGRFADKKCLHGLIVNAGNNPVEGYEISVNGKIVGESNVRGFFELSVGASDAVCFTARKKGWEQFSVEETNVDATKLYVYRVESLSVVYSKIEAMIVSGDYSGALSAISELENKSGDEQRISFLKGLVAFKEGRYEDAANYYNEAKIDVEKNPFMKQYRKKIGEALWGSD